MWLIIGILSYLLLIYSKKKLSLKVWNLFLFASGLTNFYGITSFFDKIYNPIEHLHI